MNKYLLKKVIILALSMLLILICYSFFYYKKQTVDCSTINTNGYNTQREYAYLQQISKDVQFGCGSTFGKEIFYKNIHPNKSIKGFVVKKWMYSGYEQYEVCEMHYIELKPNQISKSLGCSYISQSQPCDFKTYGKFIDGN